MDQNHQKWRNSPVTITTRHLSVDQVDSARSTVRATLESTQTMAELVIFSYHDHDHNHDNCHNHYHCHGHNHNHNHNHDHNHNHAHDGHAIL